MDNESTVTVTGKRTAPLKDGGGGIAHNVLPSLILHSFVEDKRVTGEIQWKAQEIREHLVKLNAMSIPEETVIRVKDPVTEQITETTLGAEIGKYEEALVVQSKKQHQFSKSLNDMHMKNNGHGDGNFDLTQFVTDMTWETMTTAPYANATVTLRMPSGIAHYLLHGVEAANQNYDTPDNMVFRHIETGGWASIRFPVIYKDTSVPQYRTVFFGKILGVSLKSLVNQDTGVFTSTVTLTLGSFISPMTLGESAKTVFRKGAINRIDQAAMAGYQAGTNKILSALIANLKRAGNGTASSMDMYDALHKLVEAMGHMHLPTSVAGMDPVTQLPVRLGNHIGIMGDYSDTALATIYEKNSSNINRISTAIIKEQYFAGALKGGATAIWSIVQQLFQPEPEMIELFPVIIPLGKEGTADAKAAGSGGTYDGKGGFKNSVLTDQLQAVPYIMYRYKPLPPEFGGDRVTVNNNYARTRGLRTEQNSETYFEGYFGVHDSELDVGKNKYIRINKQRVMAVDLTWSEMDRVNAVHLGFPFSTGAGNNLFGVECVPVFNIEDINRNGLRMRNSSTPFRERPFSKSAEVAAIEKVQEEGTRREKRRITDQQKALVSSFYEQLKNQRERQRTSSSAHAERMYYTIGEGHAYAKGQIVMTYYPEPDLIAGIWCLIDFHGGSDKALTFYCTAITHSVTVAPDTGLPSGTTVLTVERASYGKRIPAVDLRQVPMQLPPAPPEDKAKTKPKPKNRRSR